MELERMGDPSAKTLASSPGTPEWNIEFLPNGEYSFSLPENLDAFTGWKDYDKLENSTPVYDIKTQPETLDISLLQSEMAKVCIEVKSLGDLNTHSDYPFVHNLDEEEIFVHAISSNVDSSLTSTYGIRDGASSTEFWCIQAISEYEGTIKEDGEPHPVYNVTGNGQPTAGKAIDTLLCVFDEGIKDLLACSSQNVGLTKMRQRVLLHESLHYWLGAHMMTQPGDSGEMVSGHYTTRGIMNIDTIHICPDGDFVLDDEQMRIIQSKTAPSEPEKIYLNP